MSDSGKKLYRNDCAQQKMERIVTRVMRNKYQPELSSPPVRKSHKGIDNINEYRKHWFCKSCFNVFNIRPQRRYKTLMQFNICCPKCKSKDVAHSHLLSQAIIDKVPNKDLNEIFDQITNVDEAIECLLRSLKK